MRKSGKKFCAGCAVALGLEQKWPEILCRMCRGTVFEAKVAINFVTEVADVLYCTIRESMEMVAVPFWSPDYVGARGKGTGCWDEEGSASTSTSTP